MIHLLCLSKISTLICLISPVGFQVDWLLTVRREITNVVFNVVNRRLCGTNILIRFFTPIALFLAV